MEQNTKKKTFGGCNFSHISPELSESAPKAMNLIIGFDDALRFHLALGQALAKVNSYKRSTTAGRRAGINICIRPQSKRITVLEGVVKSPQS